MPCDCIGCGLLAKALEPLARAAEVYRRAIEGFVVEGETLAERRFSEGERTDTAREAAAEYLAGIDPSAYFLAADVIDKGGR